MKTQKQIADYEAKISLIQMGVKQYNDTVFIAPSCTSDIPHIVTVVEGQVTYCSSCRGFEFNGKCSHGVAVLRFVAEEEAKIEAQAQVAEALPVVTAWQAPANQPTSDAWLWYNCRRFNTPAGQAYLAEQAAKRVAA
jgi:hypothetical protein